MFIFINHITCLEVVLFVSYVLDDCLMSIFVLTDFSGSAWMSNNGYNTPLSEPQSVELMKEMRASQYLLEDTCTPEAGIYSPAQSGWKNGDFT